MRKRAQLVRHRTTHVLSIQNQYWRNTGVKLTGDTIKRRGDELIGDINDPNVLRALTANLEIVRALNTQIHEIEATVLHQVRLRAEFKALLSVSGIGKILALTIMLETGDIHRFPKVGQFASYCRCVDSKKMSNGKKKGEGNEKNGNKYLAWAFVEAAHFCRTLPSPCQTVLSTKTSPAQHHRGGQGACAQACAGEFLRDARSGGL